MQVRTRRAAPRPPGRCPPAPGAPSPPRAASPITAVSPRRQQPAMAPALLLPCLAALLLLLLPPGAAAAASATAGAGYSLPCERSGYCSLGKTKPYVGEVDSSLGLRAALAARSFRREVILMSSDSERMLPAMMAVQNLLRLGLEHVLMMSSSGADCVRVAGAVPTAGCVWLDFELPVFGADREFVVPAIPMWHNRYRLAARVVRLGYNVFLTDTDVIFFDDPYVYFKSPPFANYTVINQPETLYDQADYGVESEPNGGVLYIQNAAPAGPAAWMLAEVTDRLLRWIEDGFNTTRHTNSILTWCNYMDQDGLRDAISSVLLGRIFFGVSLKDCRTDSWKEAHSAEHQAIVDAIDDELRNAPGGGWGTTRVALPPPMQPVAGADTADLRRFTMHLPAHKPWDNKWGPWLYPALRGPLSSAWVAQLKEDCGGCPLWPDPEDPAAAAAAATPTESYLLAPPFLMLNWFARGRLGYWTRALGGPQQVAGHLHYIPGTDAALGKTVARMAVGHYDWALARQVLGPRMYFMHQGSSVNPQPYHEGQPGGHAPLSLLALHPALAARLAATNTWTEYSALLAGIMTVAHALKRIPVWPDPPCAAPWISEDGPRGATTLPLGIRMEFIPYGRKRSSLSCVWLPLLNGPCLLSGRGMLALEFAHWKAQVRMQFAVEPGPHNTIGRLSAAAAADPAFAPAANATPAGRIYNVAMDEVARAWGPRRTQNQRVLYLLHPLNVTFPPVTEDAFGLLDGLGDCKATNPRDVYADLEDKPYRVVRKPDIAFLPAALDATGALVAAAAVPGYNVPAPQAAAEGAADADAGAGGAAEGGGGGAGGAAGNATVVEAVVEDDGRPFHTDKGSAAVLAAADAAGAAAIAAAARAAGAAGAGAGAGAGAAAAAAGAAGADGAASAEAATTTTTTAAAASALDVASAAAAAAAAAAQAAAAIADQAAGGGIAATTAAGADGAVTAATTTTIKKKKKKKKTTLATAATAAAGAAGATDASAGAAGATAAAGATQDVATTAAGATQALVAATVQAADAAAAAAAGTTAAGTDAAAATATAGSTADAAAGAAGTGGGAVPRTTIATTEAATVAAATADPQQATGTAATAGAGATDAAATTTAADAGAGATAGATTAGATATDVVGAAAAGTTAAAGTAVDAAAAAAGGGGAAAAAANPGAVDATGAAAAGAATVGVGGAAAATDAAIAAGTATDAAAATGELVDAAATSAAGGTSAADAASATTATADTAATAGVSPSPSLTDPGVIATVDGQRVAGVHVVTAAEVAAAAAEGPEADAVRAKALSAVQGMGPFGMAAALKAAEAAGGGGGGQGLAGARGGGGGGGGGAGGFQRGGMAGARGQQFRGGAGGGMAGGGGGAGGGGRFGGGGGGTGGLRQRVKTGAGGGMRGGVGGGMGAGDMGGAGGGGGGMGGGGMGGGAGSAAAAADAAAMAAQAQFAQTQTGAAGGAGAGGAAHTGGAARVAGFGGGAGGTTRLLGAGAGAGAGSHVVNRAQWNKLQGVLGGRGTAANSDLARFQAAVAAAQGRAGLTGGGGGGNRQARGGAAARWLLEEEGAEGGVEEEVVGEVGGVEG
ncbi:hypothetical protein HXX76_007025 [Chlamydomonas incerta]|uniref:Nucleotide-diphospho-sugar transferase domain-containing protein n=1 Tax=Chlamydomonas incerta TaxID=51695 RepID=A0A835TDA2_CHLIN|nr:hypothetical protein HXX76_007025 [Chlamydomonas incerta]|eukprot:KAG2435830.1 hypothetical protein HXX76_007025 [Chlamydomonas incerta]